MKERMRFVTDWERNLYSMVELCERYGVSLTSGWSGRSQKQLGNGAWHRAAAAQPQPVRPTRITQRRPRVAAPRRDQGALAALSSAR